MRAPLIPAILLLGLTAGCGGQSSIKPVEVLDERTGVTVGVLKEPIELLLGEQAAVLVTHKRSSFAYLGPVEWNRSGVISYGLWINIVPGNDAQPGDIHAPAALTLIVDAGPLRLSPIEAPKLGHAAYQQVASWAQAGYFELTVDTLKRMAASRKLELDVRAADGSTLMFAAAQDTRAVLTQYLQARGITGD
jgi:hypothetical protein